MCTILDRLSCNMSQVAESLIGAFVFVAVPWMGVVGDQPSSVRHELHSRPWSAESWVLCRRQKRERLHCPSVPLPWVSSQRYLCPYPCPGPYQIPIPITTGIGLAIGIPNSHPRMHTYTYAYGYRPFGNFRVSSSTQPS